MSYVAGKRETFTQKLGYTNDCEANVGERRRK